MENHTGSDTKPGMTSAQRQSLAALCRAMSIGALIGATGAAVWQLTVGRGPGALQQSS